jgi:iron-sulfur cluster assembly accessory protein
MTETANVTLSDSAARRIREIVSAEARQVRIFACPSKAADARASPTSSILTISPATTTSSSKRDDARVLIDQVSLVYMAGSEIDFVDNLMGQAFQIRNPNAVASCGCGTSFSI